MQSGGKIDRTLFVCTLILLVLAACDRNLKQIEDQTKSTNSKSVADATSSAQPSPTPTQEIPSDSDARQPSATVVTGDIVQIATPLEAPLGAKRFALKEDIAMNAPGFDQGFNALYSVPIGWGYMDPMVVVKDGHAFTPLFYPCSLATPQFYCLQILRDGKAWAPAISITDQFGAAGFVGLSAYQPPMLFLADNKILVFYFVNGTHSGQPTTLLKLVSLDPSGATGTWSDSMSYLSPGEQFGYFGGAMGPNQDIVLASWGIHPMLDSIDVFYIPAPYNILNFRTTAVSHARREADHYFFAPLYPHVAIKKSGEIQITATLTNDNACPDNAFRPTNYKTVANYRAAAINQPFSLNWYDAPADVKADPAMEGKSCLYRYQRFALDTMYDSDSDKVYTLFRQQDITAANPPNAWVANDAWTQKFPIFEDGVSKVEDMTVHFKSVFTNNTIDAISMTKLTSGEFVIFANARSGTKKFAAVYSKDLKTFSEPFEIAAPYGPGHAIKVSQPNKNGTPALDQAYLWHSGDHVNSDNLNHYLRYRLLVLGLVQ